MTVDRLSVLIDSLWAWLATYALQSTIALGLVAIVMARISSAALGDSLWKAALVGPLATSSIPLVLGPAAHLGGVIPLSGAGRSLEAAPSSDMLLPGAEGMLVLLWIGGAALGMVWMEWTRRRAWRPLRRRKPVEDASIMDTLSRLQAAFGFSGRVCLTTSPSIRSPAAIGGSEICIPDPYFRRLSAAQQEAILAHELAHLARRDPLWNLASRLIAGVMFFQPLNHLAQSRLREHAEFLCDELSVRHTGRCVALVESLALLADRLQQPHPVASSGFAMSSSLLMRRVERLRRAPVSAARAASAAMRRAAVVGLLVFLVAFVPGASSSAGGRGPWWASYVTADEQVIAAGAVADPSGTRLVHVEQGGHAKLVRSHSGRTVWMELRAAQDGRIRWSAGASDEGPPPGDAMRRRLLGLLPRR